jgi:hypothetical protein
MPATAPDDIEDRLRALPAGVSLSHDDDGAVEALEHFDLAFAESRGKRRDPSPARRFAVAAAAVALVLVVAIMANTAGVYFAPRYGRILADTPGIGPISGRFLQAVGLSPSDVTLGGDSAVSAGHRLKLEAAYGDGLRIVLFVSIDGKGLTGDPKQYGRHPGEWGILYDNVSLTDQFGHAYPLWGVIGPTEPQFGPLAWPASATGGRLTLHITALWAMWKLAELGPNHSVPGDAFAIHGDWYLHTTVESQPVYTIQPPAPVQNGPAVYTITSILASGTTMIIHYRISAGPDQFPLVFDAAGNEMQMEEGGEGETSLFITGPGRYRIEFTNLVAPDQQRWIDVP